MNFSVRFSQYFFIDSCPRINFKESYCMIMRKVISNDVWNFSTEQYIYGFYVIRILIRYEYYKKWKKDHTIFCISLSTSSTLHRASTSRQRERRKGSCFASRYPSMTFSKNDFSIFSHLSPVASNVRERATSRSVSRKRMRSGIHPARASVLSERTLSIPRSCAHPCIASEETNERSETTISQCSRAHRTIVPRVCARAAAKRYAFVIGSIVSSCHSFDWAR